MGGREAEQREARNLAAAKKEPRVRAEGVAGAVGLCEDQERTSWRC